jgi:hypothetical protein
MEKGDVVICKDGVGEIQKKFLGFYYVRLIDDMIVVVEKVSIFVGFLITVERNFSVLEYKTANSKKYAEHIAHELCRKYFKSWRRDGNIFYQKESFNQYKDDRKIVIKEYY